MHDGDVAVSVRGTRRYVAFEPLAGCPGVDIAGGYSRALWRPRMGGAIWALWVAVGTRLGVTGAFECPVGGDVLSTLGDEAVVDRALVELSGHGLARRIGAGRWAVRTTCPVPASSAPPATKAGAVRHYEQLAAGARLNRWRRSRPAQVSGAPVSRAPTPGAPISAASTPGVPVSRGPVSRGSVSRGPVPRASVPGDQLRSGAPHGPGSRAGTDQVVPLAAWRHHHRAERTLAAGD